MANSNFYHAIAVYDLLAKSWHDVRLYRPEQVPFVVAEFQRSLSNEKSVYSQSPKDFILCDISAAVKYGANGSDSLDFGCDIDSSLVRTLAHGAQFSLLDSEESSS